MAWTTKKVFSATDALSKKIIPPSLTDPYTIAVTEGATPTPVSPSAISDIQDQSTSAGHRREAGRRNLRTVVLFAGGEAECAGNAMTGERNAGVCSGGQRRRKTRDDLDSELSMCKRLRNRISALKHERIAGG